MKSYQIGIIGSGNVAWNLSHSLENAGHVIVGVYSRQYANAQDLAGELYDCEALEVPDFTALDIDLLIISVSDDALEAIVDLVSVSESTVVVHTSASKEMECLRWIGNDFGVFYPLQTFTKGKLVQLTNVPFCIEASNEEVKSTLISLASTVSNQVYELNGYQRRIAHLGAVFACNFVNYMYTLASTVVESENMPFDFFHGLILETAQKAITLGPESAQTGPAKRHDMNTIRAHMNLIEANPELLAMYKMLSDGIMAIHPLEKH